MMLLKQKNYAFKILKMLLKSEIGEKIEIDFLEKNCVYKRVKQSLLLKKRLRNCEFKCANKVEYITKEI